MKIPMIYNWTIALMTFFPGTLKADLLPENPFLNLKSDKTIFYCTAPINDESVEIYKHLPLNENPDPSPYVISYKPATTQMSRGDLRLNYRKNKISSTSGAQYKTFHEWHPVPNPSHSRKYIANFPEAPNNHIKAKFKKSNNHLKAKFKNSEDELKAIFMESKNYLEAKFKSYKYNSGSQPILQRFLDERPAAKNLMLLNMSVADLKADTARIICDHLANLTHEEKDIFEFAGWMHLIAKMIDIGQVVKITPSTFAADIAFHVGLLSLQQKFALDPERTEIIEALLRILAERRQKFFRNKVFVDNFFKKYDEKLPWMREYYFPQNNLPNTLHYTLSPKIMFDKKLNALHEGINFSTQRTPEDHARNRLIFTEIGKIAQASSTSSVQSKIAALVALYYYHDLESVEEIVQQSLRAICEHPNTNHQIRILAEILLLKSQRKTFIS